MTPVTRDFWHIPACESILDHTENEQNVFAIAGYRVFTRPKGSLPNHPLEERLVMKRISTCIVPHCIKEQFLGLPNDVIVLNNGLNLEADQKIQTWIQEVVFSKFYYPSIAELRSIFPPKNA